MGKDKCRLTDYKVVFTIGSKTYTSYFSGSNDNGSSAGSGSRVGEMDTMPIIRDNRTYAPIRYLAEEFGYAVIWDSTTLTAWVSNENDMKMGHEISVLPTVYEGTLAEVEPNIDMLNSCILEIFGADVDFDLCYTAVYESEAAYDDGKGSPSRIYGLWESIDLSDCYNDPTDSYYYPVKNLKTNSEVRENLKKYMSDEIIDRYFHNDFLEYDGALYLRRGSRGYGACELDMDSLKLIEENDEKCTVSVGAIYFGESDGTYTVEFAKSQNGWIITNISE